MKIKKLFQTIKLKRFKSSITEEGIKMLEGNHFLVWFCDNTCEEVYCKHDLMRILEKDHIKGVRYIFDMTDRIMPIRDIQVNIEEI